MELNIGDRVRVKEYTDIPEQARNKGIARLAGCEGEIIDKLVSSATRCTIYKLQLDDYSLPSKADFTEDTIEFVPEEDEPQYDYEFEYLENLVVARLYEINGDEKVEIAKGHGHIFHDGVVGIAQASSYALKKILESVNNGSLT